MLLKYENNTSVKGHGRVFIFYMIAKGFYGERGEQKESVDVEPFAIVFRVGVEVEVPHPRLGRQQFESEFAPLAAGRRRARALHAVAVQVDSACSHIEIDPTLIGTQRRITIKIAHHQHQSKASSRAQSTIEHFLFHCCTHQIHPTAEKKPLPSTPSKLASPIALLHTEYKNPESLTIIYS